MLVAELQSWGKCAGCGEVIWVDLRGTGPQRAVCGCGGVTLYDDGPVVGTSDPAFTEADMQALLDEGY